MASTAMSFYFAQDRKQRRTQRDHIKSGQGAAWREYIDRTEPTRIWDIKGRVGYVYNERGSIWNNSTVIGHMSYDEWDRMFPNEIRHALMNVFRNRKKNKRFLPAYARIFYGWYGVVIE